MKTDKTKAEWEQDIIQILMKIRQEFPELSKYIKEIPVKFSETDPEDFNVSNLKDYYESLAGILKNYSKTHAGNKLTEQAEQAEQSLLPGYPYYSPAEDIYSQAKELTNLNPENLSKTKAPNEKPGIRNEKGFKEAMSGSDLDIPGSELDDQQESVGSEDEENNYYSLGGDVHNDLEVDKG